MDVPPRTLDASAAAVGAVTTATAATTTNDLCLYLARDQRRATADRRNDAVIDDSDPSRAATESTSTQMLSLGSAMAATARSRHGPQQPPSPSPSSHGGSSQSRVPPPPAPTRSPEGADASPFAAASLTDPPPDAAPLAQLYCRWTRSRRAPWDGTASVPSDTLPTRTSLAAAATAASSSSPPTSLSSGGAPPRLATRTVVRPTARGEALVRLDRDLEDAIDQGYDSVTNASASAAIDADPAYAIPFCGRSLSLQRVSAALSATGDIATATAPPSPVVSPPPLRVVFVLWSPSYLAAKCHSLTVAQTAEAALVDMTRRFMHRHGVDLTLSVAYVIPRWTSAPFPGAALHGGTPVCSGAAGTFVSKFMTTAPAALAAGAWQLGLRLCMLQPHIVVATSVDTARMLACTHGLDPACLATEAAKGLVAQQRPPSLDVSQTATEGPVPGATAPVATLGPFLPPITRRAMSANADPDTHPTTLRLPTNPDADPPVQLLACPHPYQFSRVATSPADAAQIRLAKARAAVAMATIARIATERGFVRTRTSLSPAASLPPLTFRLFGRVGSPPRVSQPPPSTLAAPEPRPETHDPIDDGDGDDDDDDDGDDLGYHDSSGSSGRGTTGRGRKRPRRDGTSAPRRVSLRTVRPPAASQTTTRRSQRISKRTKYNPPP